MMIHGVAVGFGAWRVATRRLRIVSMNIFGPVLQNICDFLHHPVNPTAFSLAALL